MFQICSKLFRRPHKLPQLQKNCFAVENRYIQRFIYHYIFAQLDEMHKILFENIRIVVTC